MKRFPLGVLPSDPLQLFRNTQLLPRKDNRPASTGMAVQLCPVVGLLLAALYNPVWSKGIHGAADMIVGLAAFGLLHFWKAPPWLVVGLALAAGMVFLG